MRKRKSRRCHSVSSPYVSLLLSPRFGACTAGVHPFPLAMQHFYSFVSATFLFICLPGDFFTSPNRLLLGFPMLSKGVRLAAGQRVRLPAYHPLSPLLVIVSALSPSCLALSPVLFPFLLVTVSTLSPFCLLLFPFLFPFLLVTVSALSPFCLPLSPVLSAFLLVTVSALSPFCFPSCLSSSWSSCPPCLPSVSLCLRVCLPCWSVCPPCLPSVSFCLRACLPSCWSLRPPCLPLSPFVSLLVSSFWLVTVSALSPFCLLLSPFLSPFLLVTVPLVSRDPPFVSGLVSLLVGHGVRLVSFCFLLSPFLSTFLSEVMPMGSRFNPLEFLTGIFHCFHAFSCDFTHSACFNHYYYVPDARCDFCPNSLLLEVLNSFLRCVRPFCHCWCPPFSAGHAAFLFICLAGDLVTSPNR